MTSDPKDELQTQVGVEAALESLPMTSTGENNLMSWKLDLLIRIPGDDLPRIIMQYHAIEIPIY